MDDVIKYFTTNKIIQISYINIQPKHMIFKNLHKNKKKLEISFLKGSITALKTYKFLLRRKKQIFFLFLNKFFLNFLEFFFKSKIIFNLKKGSNRLILTNISYRVFINKYFKKNLLVSKQIIGILYYSFLLKDTSIFVNYFKNILEKLNIKLHKKLFLSLKKLIKDLFKPIFNFLGLLGVFFDIRGKIGVSGSAKKKRYFFYFGKHTITTRSIKINLKHTPIWTFTGVLGFTFSLYF